MKLIQIEKLQPSREGVLRVLVLIGTTIIVSMMMTALIYSVLVPKDFQLGEIAETSIRAPRDFLIEDRASSAARQADAARSVKTVFTIFDPDQKLAGSQLEAFFVALGSYLEMAASGKNVVRISAKEREALQSKFGVALEDADWTLLQDNRNWERIERAVSAVSYPILKRGIIANKEEFFDALRGAGAVIRDLAQKEERTLTDLYNVPEAIESFEQAFPSSGLTSGDDFDGLVLKLKHLKLKPNVFLDEQETKARVRTAAEAVERIYFKVQQGELIVAAGDRITESQLHKLNRLHELYASTNLVRTFLAYFLVSLITLGVAYAFATASWWNFVPTNRDLLLTSLTIIGSFALVHFYSILSMSLSLYFPSFGTDFFVFATPFAAGGILLEVMLGTPGLLLFVIPFSVFTAIFFENSLVLFTLILLGNIVGAVALRRSSTRSAFLRAGLKIAAVNLAIVFALLLLAPKDSPVENLAALVAAVLGGLSSGIVGAGLAPVAEFLGRYVTDSRLLELASLDQPLLLELSLQAPGTWNHSMVMGQMGEVAAHAVGANGLLTRVGAYYHDVGKARKPAYFVENQTSGENRHDRLSPSMSALIVRSHVKDGIEMATEQRLPESIIDFIPQHHGTALMEFFYEKAVRDAEKGEEVDENLYRYPGPKPQTKEAGILMLADGVEAASRTLSDPTPAKIMGLVQKQINRVFASGQLDECELTLRDLHQIAKSFAKVLMGIYHRRIEYSEPAEKVRELRAVRTQEKNGSEEKESTGKGEKQEEGERTKSRVEESTETSRNVSQFGRGESAKENRSEKTDKNSNGSPKRTLRRLGM